MLGAPHPLRFLFTTRPAVMSPVLGIVYRGIGTHLTNLLLDTAYAPRNLGSRLIIAVLLREKYRSVPWRCELPSC